MRSALVILICAVTVAGGAAVAASSADSRAPVPRVAEDTLLASQQGTTQAPQESGRDLFLTYCASCHGAQARGGGPMAAQLRRDTPDLTLFTLRNGGVFPSARVARIIDGRDVPSHGSREMPVWGDAFKRSVSGALPDAVARRIAALTSYLETIQQRRGE